MEKMLSFCNCL